MGKRSSGWRFFAFSREINLIILNTLCINDAIDTVNQYCAILLIFVIIFILFNFYSSLHFVIIFILFNFYFSTF